MAYLELQNLSKRFSKRAGLFTSRLEIVDAVKDVSLTIEQGEILGLVGESGCGKSTLSRLVMQLLHPTSGSVILEGERLADLTPESIRARRRDFQMIFQDPYASLNPRMTVFSTLAESILTRHPDKSASEIEQSVGELMERVGLDVRYVRKYPHEFSGGQRQRIAIARALGTEPKLVIADEPVSALDVSIQSQILNLLLRLRDELNLTMIFISHDLAVVRYLSDRIVVMDEGQVVEIGEANAVFENPQSETAKALLAAVPQIQVA
ncbi:MAG: ATP-binding cassette domain-containing protein [Verrucomicrobiota bacterium]